MKTLAAATAKRACEISKNSRNASSGRRLNVLVLDEELPYPLNSGKRIRTWNLLQRLAKRHSVTLLCYGQADDPAARAVLSAGIQLLLVKPKKNLAGWRLYLQLLINVFSTQPFSVAKHYSRRFQKKVNALLAQESWDLVHCEWTPYARFVPRQCRVPVLISTHNVESQILQRRKENIRNPVSKIFFWTQETKMRRFERAALLRVSKVTAVTRGDLQTMQAWGVKDAVVVPNGVDLETFHCVPDHEQEGEILALASLDWYPNIDALRYFVGEILPLLRAQNPEMRFRIVGRKPSESLGTELSSMPGVDFTGEVQDALPYVSRAAVFVVPLRIGGGSRIKILEALAAGKAVVSTSIGAEGLDVVHGKHLLIADSPTAFARCVDELLASKVFRRKLGEEGRGLVAERYGWDGIAAELESVWLGTSLDNLHPAPVNSSPQEAHATS